MLKESLQEVLEAEMTEVIGAGPGERTAERSGYRAGYYSRSLVTRIGKLELRVPRDRDGRFSTVSGAAQPQCRRTASTCANVLKLWPALWGFIAHAGVQPINNSAEQALRGILLKPKISGPTRSRRGDEFIANGFSAYESCRRQGRDFIGYMRSAVIAWIDKTAHSSLVPAPAPSG